VEVEEGVRLFYQLHGDDDAPEKVILVMGWVCAHNAWDGAVSFFSQHPRYQLCVFDNRGIGYSSIPPGPYTMHMMAKDTLKLADHLKWQTFHLLGASMGGMISLRLATIAPERLRSLTLVATRAQGGFTMPSWKVVGLLLKMQIFRKIEHQITYNLQMLYPEAYLNSTLPNGKIVREHIHKKLLERRQAVPLATRTGMFAQMSAFNGHHLTDSELQTLKEKNIKTLLFTGDQDEMVSPTNSYKMKEQLGAELVVYEGAGHGINEQCEDKIYPRTMEHFESVLK